MRNTTLNQTWFGAKGDAWTPFVNALTDLGLGVEILLPKRLMDTGPARGGVYEHGWFCLGKPWEHESLLASRLAARLGAPVELIRCKAKATIREDGIFYAADLDGDRLLPDGSRAPLPVPDDTIKDQDGLAGGAMDEAETDELLREWTEEITHGLRSALKDDSLPTFTFKLKIPRGWTPPDRFSLVMKGAAGGLAATLTRPDGHTEAVSAEERAWIVFRLGEAGAFDNDMPKPDLGRWVERLKGRHGLSAEPSPDHPAYAAFTADLERLSKSDRSAKTADGRRVPRWKLSDAGLWELSAAECLILADRLGRPKEPQQRAWAERWERLLRAATQGLSVRVA
jgi:hypothetical protein